MYGIEFSFKFLIKVIFGLIGLFLIITFKIPYILGLLWGMLTMAYIFLFPTQPMIFLLDKMFNYSKNLTVVMKNESEENYRKIKSKGYNKRVKFKR